MKTTFVAAAVVAVAGLATAATAGTLTIETGNWQTSNGGEFRARPLAGLQNQVLTGLFADQASAPGTFQTFCIEQEQSFGAYNTAYNAVVATSADPGNNGNPTSDPSPDPISSQTAWLYEAFRTGGLAGLGYDYGASAGVRKGDARALQIVFWMLEEELPQQPGGPPNGGTGWLTQANIDFAHNFLSTYDLALGNDMNDAAQRAFAIALFDAAIEATDGDGIADSAAHLNGLIGRTRVANLRAINSDGSLGGRQQDMLVLVPLPPAAWAGLGTMGCVLGFAAIRRRRLTNA